MRALPVLLLCAACACSGRPFRTVVATAPRCALGFGDLGTAVMRHEAVLLMKLPADHVLTHTATDSLRFISQAATPRLFVYSGHGLQEEPGEAAVTKLCFEDSELPVEKLIAAALSDSDATAGSLPRGPTTLVLNACYEGRVDLRQAKGPVSVIAASPGAISPDAKFVDALEKALDTDLDQNCDGLVTDQELFARISDELVSLNLAADLNLRAYPRLIRNRATQLPLPVASHCPESKRVRPELTQKDKATELWLELQHQDALTRGPGPLPELDWDYFVVEARSDVPHSVVENVLSQVQSLVGAEGARPSPSLRRFPGDQEEAKRIAEYAIFTEIYLLEIRDPYVRITRLRDNVLLGTRRIQAGDSRQSGHAESLKDILPGRDVTKTIARTASPDGPTETLRIITDRWASQLDSRWAVVPCETTSIGQCFMPKRNDIRESRGKQE